MTLLQSRTDDVQEKEVRATVLEVVHHDTATDTYVVAAGWGETSHWLRNVRKTPMVSVQVGNRNFEAMAKRLSIRQAQSALLAYARRHPWAFPVIAKLIVGRRLKPTEEDCLILAQSMPVIGLISRGQMTGHSSDRPGACHSDFVNTGGWRAR